MTSHSKSNVLSFSRMAFTLIKDNICSLVFSKCLTLYVPCSGQNNMILVAGNSLFFNPSPVRVGAADLLEPGHASV